MRRIDRLFKILISHAFTTMGQLDVLRIVRTRGKKEELSLDSAARGRNLHGWQNDAIHFQVLGQVLFDEVYSEVDQRDKIVVDLGAHKEYFAANALMRGQGCLLQ